MNFIVGEVEEQTCHLSSRALFFVVVIVFTDDANFDCSLYLCILQMVPTLTTGCAFPLCFFFFLTLLSQLRIFPMEILSGCSWEKPAATECRYPATLIPYMVECGQTFAGRHLGALCFHFIHRIRHSVHHPETDEMGEATAQTRLLTNSSLNAVSTSLGHMITLTSTSADRSLSLCMVLQLWK